jgi:hypothetical protein
MSLWRLAGTGLLIMLAASPALPQGTGTPAPMHEHLRQTSAVAPCELWASHSEHIDDSTKSIEPETVEQPFGQSAQKKALALQAPQLVIMLGRALSAVGLHREAAAIYRLAAYHGDARAQSELGRIYSLGIGVEQDLKAAENWFLSSGQEYRVLRSRAMLTHRCMLGTSISMDLECRKMIMRHFAGSPRQPNRDMQLHKTT